MQGTASVGTDIPRDLTLWGREDSEIEMNVSLAGRGKDNAGLNKMMGNEKTLKSDKTTSTMAGSFMDRFPSAPGAPTVLQLGDDMEELSEGDCKQWGYTDNIFGFVSYIIFWILSALWFIWLLLVVLDFYGMHVWTLCDEVARTKCEQAQNLDPLSYFSSRTGYTCGSGCLFSWRWTAGTSRVWPYYHYDGGGFQIDAVFIVSWHVALLWFIAVKSFQPKLLMFFKTRCSLERAQYVLITRPKDPIVFVDGDENSFVLQVVSCLDRFRDKYLGGNTVTKTCKVLSDSSGTKYFDFQCLRYCWSPVKRKYIRANVLVGSTFSDIRKACRGLQSFEAQKRLEAVGSNTLNVNIAPLHIALFTEFFDWFYIYQFFCLWVWMGFFYWQMGCVILLAVVASGIVKVFTKRSSEFQVKSMAESMTNMVVLRDGMWVPLTSNNLVPGDVVLINNGDSIVCDCVMLEGSCVVDESSLTGEPTPVAKISIGLSGSDGSRVFKKGGDNLKYTLLAGTSVQSVAAGSNGVVSAVVLSTGAQTEKGQLIRNMLFPPQLSFKFDQHWKLVFIILLLWGLIIFGVCVKLVNGHLVGWYYGVSTISQIMSPLIPAVFVASRANSARRLAVNNSIFCVNLDRILVAGKVKIFCFDKTGTLTKPGLEFRCVVPIDPVQLTLSSPIGVNENTGNVAGTAPPIEMALGCAHELVLSPSTTPSGTSVEGYVPERAFDLVGNEVDRRMYQVSGFRVNYDRTLRQSDGSRPGAVGNLVVESDDAKLKIVRRFEFDRSSMSMSCIVEDLTASGPSPKYYVFSKGTYETISANSSPSLLPLGFSERGAELSREGFYVLGIAWKEYDGPSDVLQATRDEIESNLTPLGLLVFYNGIKPDTALAIRDLKEGSIRPVMITGDNIMTAVKVARECGLSTARMLIIGESDGDLDSLIVWKDVDTQEMVDPFSDQLQALESGFMELALTGSAFDKLCRTPIAENPESDVFNEMNTPASPRLPTNYLDSVGTNVLRSQMKCLIRYTRIFARMKPEQKVLAVQMCMTTGITAMCGDGANDAGALRMAHVGLAVGNVTPSELSHRHSAHTCDATVVAPFSTPFSSLTAAVTIVREGRCTLATSLAGYKDLMIYGEVMVAISMVMYYYGVNMSEPYWVTVDSFINLGMAWAIMQARPNKKLTSIRPSSKLLGAEVMISVMLQIALNCLFLAIAMVVLFRQDWFVCKEFDSALVDAGQWWVKGDNYEAEVIALFSFFQLLNAAAIFNFGFDYRQSWHRNYWVVGLWALGLVFGLFLLFSPPGLIPCLYRINCGDQSLLERWGSLGLINSSGIVPSAPPGCPCDTQISTSETCESEYADCNKLQWNQTYHHNIMPMSFRWVIFILLALNTIFGFVLEGIFIVGPIRRKFREKKLGARHGLRPNTSQGLVSGPFGTVLSTNKNSGVSRLPNLVVGDLEILPKAGDSVGQQVTSLTDARTIGRRRDSGDYQRT